MIPESRQAGSRRGSVRDAVVAALSRIHGRLSPSAGLTVDRRVHPDDDPAALYVDARWPRRLYVKAANSGLRFANRHGRSGTAAERPASPLFDTEWYLAEVERVLEGDPVEPAAALSHYLSVGVPARLDPHPLFSASWYRRQVPELPDDKDPLGHYFAEGAHRDLDPHPLFSTAWYRRHAGLAAEINPLAHFLGPGTAAGLDGSPLVDRAFYFAQNPDVAARELDPLLHYARFGAAEGRGPHPLLDTRWYAEQHPEVEAVGIPALVHYLLEGVTEEYDPSPLLNVRWYTERNPQAAAPGTVPLLHAVTEGADRDLDPNPYVDSEWYRARYPEVSASGLTPLTHFLVVGAAAGYDPSPRFETTWYLRAYPDIARSVMNPLVHFLVDGDYQGREPTSGRDPVPRLMGPDGAWFVRQVGQAARHEPLLANTIARGLTDHSLATRAPRSGARDALRELIGSLAESPDRLVLVHAFPLGGAERVAANFANAALALYPRQSVLVLATDADTSASVGWFDPSAEIRFLRLDRALDLTRRGTALARFVDAMRPRSVLNVNSHAGWDMLERHGAALRQSTTLTAALFCRDYSRDGVLGGYADRYFRSTFHVLDALYSDHEAFVRELSDTYGVTEAQRHRLAPVYQPMRRPDERASDRRVASDPPVVLWAGRIAAQKRPELLLEVARRLPEVKFAVYGRPDDQHLTWLDQAPLNVEPRGAFSGAAELPLSEVDAFLYTSAWDGLPNVLLEVASAGVPIVATAVGGIGELVTTRTGWAVSSSTADDVAAALAAALADPAEARRRGAAAAHLVSERHTDEAFRAAVATTPFLAGAREHAHTLGTADGHRSR